MNVRGFFPHKKIETPRLVLRPLDADVEEDVKFLFEHWSNDEVLKYMEVLASYSWRGEETEQVLPFSRPDHVILRSVDSRHLTMRGRRSRRLLTGTPSSDCPLGA